MPVERGIDGTGRKDVVGIIGWPGVGMTAGVNMVGYFIDDDDGDNDDGVAVDVDMGIVIGIELGIELGMDIGKKEGIEVGQ